jgi:pyruvate dehydrogenase E2 component (dihydrolipoamide acetyltransferase)
MATIIEMPKLSDTMTVGTLVKWLKKEGEAVSTGEMLAEVETDKATMELECFEDGVLLKQIIPAGAQVDVGAPIAAIGKKGEKFEGVSSGGGKSAKAEAPAPKNEAPSSKPAESSSGRKTSVLERAPRDRGDAAPDRGEEANIDPARSTAHLDELAAAAAANAPQAEAPAEASDDGSRLKSSPLARKIAKEKGVDLSSVKGSGPGGRIVRADVLAAAAAPKPAAPSAPAAAKTAAPAPAVASLQDREVPVSNIRATIARRLVESKTQLPHFYLETEADAAPLGALRASINEGLGSLAAEQGGLKVSVNDLILKATVEALRRVPAANASWMGDKIKYHGSVHLAFGVAVEEGLLTPVIKNAQAKSLRQIAAEAKELIGKARSKKLKPDEMTGSTFTVTNLGMYGITSFYGIINPPNAAILSVGATVKKPVVNAKGEIVVGERMILGISGDHRVIDGAVGAQFLAALRELIEKPALFLV